MKAADFIVESALSSLVSQDQSERQEYQNFIKTKAGGDWDKGAQLYAQSKGRTPDDIFGEKQRLSQFMSTKFDFNTFIEKDWKNYWLLAQHCDFNRKFQKQALGIIQKYLGVDNDEYKYLYDRVSCGLNGTQKFGTQDHCNKD